MFLSITCLEVTRFFVLWNWIWVGDSSTTPSVSSSTYSSESPLDDSSSEDDAIPAITHTVIFKCIGVTKERGTRIH